MHQAVFRQTMQGAGLGLAGLEALHGLGHRHLINHDLTFRQRHFRNAVTCLYQRRFVRASGRIDACCALKKSPDIDGVDRVVRALVDHFERIVGSDDRGRDLDPPRAPTIGQRHFA